VKIEKAKHLTSRKFKPMTGVSCQTFELMVDVVKADAQKKKKTGRPRLIIEDQVLMVI
jgi:hypothetical protein